MLFGVFCKIYVNRFSKITHLFCLYAAYPLFYCLSFSLFLCVSMSLSLSHTHTCLVKIENCKRFSTLGPLTLTLMLYIHLSLSFHSPLRIVVFSFSCDRKMLRDRKGLDEGHRISKLGDEI